jgi:ATP-binding cassette, subfamily B, bacterial MsbA
VSLLRRLLAYTRPHRARIAFAVVMTLFSSAVGLVFPQVTGQLVEVTLRGRESSSGVGQLNGLVLALLGVFAAQAVFSGVQTYLIAWVGERVVARIRTDVFAHLVNLPVQFFESRKTGEIMTRLTSDVAAVQGAVSGALAQVFSLSVTLIGSVVLLFVSNAQLALVILVVLPVVILVARVFGGLLRRATRRFLDAVADANGNAEEAIAGIRVVQSFTNEPLETSRYAFQVDRAVNAGYARIRIRATFQPLITFALFSSIAVVLWYGGRLVIDGALQPGQLVSFLLYAFLAASSFASATNLYAQFVEAVSASSRIFEVLDTHSDLPQPSKPRVLEALTGRVTFERVSFRYGDRGEDHVLHEISLEVRPGEVIALVGPSGAGKSTLVSLLPRFYDVSSGSIRVDGVDVREFNLRDLRAHIGIVPQETQLFGGSVADNIRYGKPEASDLEVRDAARAANAVEFIERFPQGFETIVGERGVKLSGGQRQRVAIARAVLKNPRVLILDEATSALDNESEALVQEALERLMLERTTFVIAHRLSTVRNAHRIVVLADGRIKELGSHDALLRQGGLYAALYERQFRDTDRSLS